MIKECTRVFSQHLETATDHRSYSAHYNLGMFRRHKILIITRAFLIIRHLLVSATAHHTRGPQNVHTDINLILTSHQNDSACNIPNDVHSLITEGGAQEALDFGLEAE
jgi:hypothetical protein